LGRDVAMGKKHRQNARRGNHAKCSGNLSARGALQAVRQGDFGRGADRLDRKPRQDAMHALFVRHQVRVFRFLTRLLGGAAAAEDLVSETFIEIWRHAAQFKSRAKASTWIMGIARHKAASARRQRSFARFEDAAIESRQQVHRPSTG
jgi:hypothetical protein